jgi:hypothetical protein
MPPDKELFFLFFAVIGGLLGGMLFNLPVIVYRLIKKQPIIPKGKKEKLQSPRILYAGVALFGGMAVFSFMNGLRYFALAFVLFSCAYDIGLIAYRRGWRG